MFEPIVLIADVDGIVQLIIFLIIILGPVLKGIFGGGGGKPKPAKRRPAPRPPQRPAQRPPQRPAQNLPPPQAGGGGADKLENEIEEFLRRASGQAPARPKQPARAEVVQAEVVRAEPVTPGRRQPNRGLQQTPTPNHKRPKPVRKKPQRKKPEKTPARIKRRPLGSSISDEIDRMEDHVHDVFDHDLGQLGGSTVESGADIDDRGTDSEVWESMLDRRDREKERQADQTSDIFEMIRNPKTAHQAVIIGEILKRPNF